MTNQSNPEPELRRAISKTGYSAMAINSDWAMSTYKYSARPICQEQ